MTEILRVESGPKVERWFSKNHLFQKVGTSRRWRSWITWHLECEIQCGLFKAGGTNSSRLAKKILWTSLSFFFFQFLSFSPSPPLFPSPPSLSVSNNQEKRNGGRASFFFYFLSRLLYASRTTIILSYSSRCGAFLEKTRRNKKREKLICVAGMWQKRKLWIEERRRCR